MTTKNFQHHGRIILAGFIHHTLLSEWLKNFEHLSTSVLIYVLNFLLGNKKATRQTILSSLINWLVCRRSSISVGRELWLLCRRMQIKVFDRRRRWHFPRGVLEVFVFSRRRTRPFPLGVLELWDLRRRRRQLKLHVALELLVSSRRRRWHMLLVALEILVSSRRSSRMLCVALVLWALRLFHWRRQPSPCALLEL
jgi:hypothetical protein